MSFCKKCEKKASVLLRKKDFYCRDCFIINTSHKFRACIGKNKIIPANKYVLICLSGGPGSTVLLDLIHKAVSLNNHKKLWITPIFFHLMGMSQEADDLLSVKAVIEQCNQYNVNIYIGHIAEYVSLSNNLPVPNTVPEVNTVTHKQFASLINSMSVTTKNDFLLKIARDLYMRYAKMLQCNFIFSAETSGTLATNLLSNLVNGRGSQVQNDIGFCDSRDEIKIIRPMRDISQEEVQYYININHLATRSSNNSNRDNSLQSVITQFVAELQDNFQSTISTVCKTADKIGVQDLTNCYKKCALCESAIGAKHQKLTALEATNHSRSLSIGQSSHYTSGEFNDAFSNLSMFPYINEYLCYTCSRNYSEMDSNKLPLHVRQMLNSNNNKIK